MFLQFLFSSDIRNQVTLILYKNNEILPEGRTKETKLQSIDCISPTNLTVFITCFSFTCLCRLYSATPALLLVLTHQTLTHNFVLSFLSLSF